MKLVMIEGRWRRVALDYVHKTVKEWQEKEEVKAISQEIDRKCRTCAFIAYSGVHEIIQQTGSCRRRRDSGKLLVSPDQDVCDHWRASSKAVMLTRAKKRLEQTEKLGKIKKR